MTLSLENIHKQIAYAQTNIKETIDATTHLELST